MHDRRLLIIGLLGLLLCGQVALAVDHSTILITDFCHSTQTQQGGFFRCMGGRPDQVADRLVTHGQAAARAWRIDLSDAAAGEGVGVLLPLFDETTPGSPLLHMRRNLTLTGRFQGQLGSRRLRIELLTTKDPEAAGLPLGIVEADQLEGNAWKEIRLPVARDRRRTRPAAFIRIMAEGQGAAWFAIDSLALSSKRRVKIASQPPAAHALRKAIWLWSTEKTVADKARRAALLETCRTHGITDLYCQIPYSYEDGEIRLRLVDEQRAFNAAAHAQGITTHALDGSPEYVVKKNHPRMLQLIDALGQLNEQSAPNERYRAVHLDNEPYVLPAWRNDTERQQIIQDYIFLNQQLRRKADELDMKFGVDIPFWWDDLDDEGKPLFLVESETGEQPILEALFPLLDNVGVMSYRDRVTGPNGLVAHCLNEFALGQTLGVDVFAAAELGAGADVEPGTTFGVYPWAYFRNQLSTLENFLSRTPGCRGLAIHHWEPFAEAMK